MKLSGMYHHHHLDELFRPVNQAVKILLIGSASARCRVVAVR
jgi:hypothetical protein